MKTRVDLTDDHIVAELHGQRLILDTGSPISFSRADAGQLLLKRINGLSGLRADGLMGMDLLGKAPFEIDPETSTLTFGEPTTIEGGQQLHMFLQNGLPIVQSFVNGTPRALVVDTAAVRTFLLPRLLWGSPTVGAHDDFHHSFGKFSTALHEVWLGLRSRGGSTVTVASLPSPLWAAVQHYYAEGILGNDILLQGKVHFDPIERVITLDPKKVKNTS